MVDLVGGGYSLSIDDMLECWEQADRELEEDLRKDKNWQRYMLAVEKTRVYDLRQLVINS